MCCCFPLVTKWLAKKFHGLVHNVSLETEDETKIVLLSLFDRITSKRVRFRYSSFSSQHLSTEFHNSEEGTDWLLTDQLWPTLGEWNIYNLYSHVLHSVVQGIDNESTELDAKGVFTHLKQVFHIEDGVHEKLLQTVRDNKESDFDVANLVLNLEIVEGRGLQGKVANDMIHPFCTSFIHEQQQHNTCMKQQTLNPVWREYFSFPVMKIQEDVLHVEVWNYDAQNKLSDKLERFIEMKSRSGSLCTMMKEWVDMTNAAGQQTHEFLGCLKIPLKNLKEDEGLNKWYTLESRSGYKKNGEIHLRMGLCAKKEKKVASQEYRHLLHLLLVHELEEESVQPYQWEGKFAKYADYILSQFQKHEDLSQMDVDLAQWMVYTRIHCVRPLHAYIFLPIVTNLIQYLQNSSISHYEIRRFWLASEKFIESFSIVVNNIADEEIKSINAQIEHMLQTLSMLKAYLVSLSKSSALETDVTPSCIIENVTSAIEDRAHHVSQKITQEHLNSTENPVEDMTRVGELLIKDLIDNCQTYNDLFLKFLGVKYYDITYRVYEKNYGKVVKLIVQDWEEYLKLRKTSGVNSYNDVLNCTLKLYMILKEFSILSLPLDSIDGLFVRGTFHNWFYFCVTECLEVKCSTALDEIKKVVHLDPLEPVDNFAQFSDSTISMGCIFKDMEQFWKRLCWPDVEGSYEFLSKIVDNLCRYVQFYVESMSYKICVLEKLTFAKDEKYEITEKVCIAINNIDWLKKEVHQMTDKLGTASIWNELTDTNGKQNTATKEKLLLIQVEATSHKMTVKIIETLQMIGNKMRPVIIRLFLKGIKHDNKDRFSKLQSYLNKNLSKLQEHLMSDILLEKFIYFLWENISVVLLTETKKAKSNNIAKHIPEVLQSLMSLFCSEWNADSDILHNTNICEIEDLIKMNNGVCYTTDWIVKYYQERLKSQSEITFSGKNEPALKISSLYSSDDAKLFIEILSVSNLKSRDSKDQCKPYVTMRVILKSMLSDTPPKYKTKIQKGTTTIFDETFSITLTPNDMKKDGMIVFSVKDHNKPRLIKSNNFLGESFMPLDSIATIRNSSETKNSPKTHLLPLTMPSHFNLDSLKALADRPWDKVATNFVKYERTKVTKLMKR